MRIMRLPGPGLLRRSQIGGSGGGQENLPSVLGKDPASPKLGRASEFGRGSALERWPPGRGETHPSGGGKPLSYIVGNVQRDFHVSKFNTRILRDNAGVLLQRGARGKGKRLGNGGPTLA